MDVEVVIGSEDLGDLAEGFAFLTESANEFAVWFEFGASRRVWDGVEEGLHLRVHQSPRSSGLRPGAGAG